MLKFSFRRVDLTPVRRRLENEGYKIVSKDRKLTKEGVITRKIVVESDTLRGTLSPTKAELHSKTEELTKKDSKFMEIVGENYPSIIDLRELIKMFIVGFTVGCILMYVLAYL